MRLEKMRVAYLVAADFEDLEFWVPVMRLREEGALVTIVGLHAGEWYRGKGGLPACADVGCEEAIVADFDAIVIPGGWAPDGLRRRPGVMRLVRGLHAAGKVVGMICHAGLVGISAGIVQGVEATGSEGIKDDLINAGARWRNEPAFQVGNLVWGRIVADIPDFCRVLVTALEAQRRE
jgi:protease I